MLNKTVIIITHGNLVHELIKTCEIFAGEQPNFYGLSVLPGDTIEAVSCKLDQILSKTEIEHDKNEFIICVDILGGTPFNVACLQKKTCSNVHVISGVNLPILLFLALEIDSCSTIDEIKNLFISEVSDSIKFI